MDSQSSKRIFAFTFVLLAFLIALAVPLETASAAGEKPPYVRFTVINNSQFDFSISLFGTQNYTISVPAHSQGFWIVDRGWYSFSMTSCNFTETGTINLTIPKTMHVPVCGGRALANVYKPYQVDVANFIKPIRVEVVNETFEEIGVYIRTLEKDHFLNLEPKGTQEVILRKQEYTFSYVACDELITGTFTPYVRRPFKLNCAED